MKKFLGGLSVLVASLAHSGAKYQEVESTSIIPLEVATAVYSFDRYRATLAGMEVCFEEHWANGGRCDKWFAMTKAIPSGATFVGWRIGHGSYGHRKLDIYFK